MQLTCVSVHTFDILYGYVHVVDVQGRRARAVPAEVTSIWRRFQPGLSPCPAVLLLVPTARVSGSRCASPHLRRLARTVHLCAIGDATGRGNVRVLLSAAVGQCFCNKTRPDVTLESVTRGEPREHMLRRQARNAAVVDLYATSP